MTARFLVLLHIALAGHIFLEMDSVSSMKQRLSPKCYQSGLLASKNLSDAKLWKFSYDRSEHSTGKFQLLFRFVRSVSTNRFQFLEDSRDMKVL